MTAMAAAAEDYYAAPLPGGYKPSSFVAGRPPSGNTAYYGTADLIDFD